MVQKIKAILGSIRFWILTLTGVVAVLSSITDGTASLQVVFDIIEKWLIAVVGLGTLDSVATKYGEAKASKK